MQLHIRVKPNSKIDEIIRDPDGTLRVKIKAPPIDGKANKYLVEYLAKYFDLPKSTILVLKGLGNQYKTIEINADEHLIGQKLP